MTDQPTPEPRDPEAPENLVGALHGPVHVEPTETRPAKSFKARDPNLALIAEMLEDPSDYRIPEACAWLLERVGEQAQTIQRLTEEKAATMRRLAKAEQDRETVLREVIALDEEGARQRLGFSGAKILLAELEAAQGKVIPLAEAFAQIRRRINERWATNAVPGIPRNDDGNPGPATEEKTPNADAL